MPHEFTPVCALTLAESLGFWSVCGSPKSPSRRMRPDFAISAQPRPLVARSTAHGLSPLPISRACTTFFDLVLIGVVSTCEQNPHPERLPWTVAFLIHCMDSGLESEMDSNRSPFFQVVDIENKDTGHNFSITRLSSNINIRLGSIPTDAKSNHPVSQSGPSHQIISSKAEAVQPG